MRVKSLMPSRISADCKMVRGGVEEEEGREVAELREGRKERKEVKREEGKRAEKMAMGK